MKYEVTLAEGEVSEKGRISLDRLAKLANVLMDIARDAFQIKVQGYSKHPGRRPTQVMRGVKIELLGLREGSTILELESKPFIHHLSGIQLELGKSELDHLMAQETGMSLIIKSFQEAIIEEDDEHLDKPLLKDMRKLQELLLSDRDSLTISNGTAASSITLSKEEFEKLQLLDEKTPEPERVMLIGKLDVLEHAKARVKIMTDEGMATGLLTESVKEGDIKQYWGKELVISGTAHYRPNGKLSYVQIDKISEPTHKDPLFRQLPKSESVEQQIERQLKEGKKANPLNQLIGQWPGDESLDDLLEMLK